MKKIPLLFILIFLLGSLKAQQWVVFSQQNNYKLFNNASLAGADSEIHATIANRNQYTFISNRNIASQFVEFSMPVFKKNYGLGLNVVNDFIGYQRFTSVALNGAYHLYTKKSRFSFGFGVGFVNIGLDGSKYRAAAGNYENGLVIHNDENLPNESTNGNAPSFSFGFSYKWQGLDFGAAIQNINSPKVQLLGSSLGTNVYLDRTFNSNIGYLIELKGVNIRPALNYYTDLVKHQFQLEIISEINNIYFGVAFRGYSGLNNDAIIAMLGIKLIDKIRINYSYDLNVSGLNKSNFGSHELSISYTLPKKFSTKSRGNLLFNPRFL